MPFWKVFNTLFNIDECGQKWVSVVSYHVLQCYECLIHSVVVNVQVTCVYSGQSTVVEQLGVLILVVSARIYWLNAVCTQHDSKHLFTLIEAYSLMGWGIT